MLDRKIKQRGFGAVQGILFLVVVGVIASVAWLTYSRYQTAHQAKSTSNAASLTSANTPTAKTPMHTQQPAAVANQNVEKIPELGIQITVPDDIMDLKYQVHTGTVANGIQATFAFFSTAALANLDAACSPSSAPLGSLERVNGQYPSNDQLAGAKYGLLVKQFPTFYIAAGLPQAECSTNASVNGAAVKFKSEFATAESTIQQLN
jgi:CRISPR/Cas system CMR-associated protein Cmr5 small subunit